MECQQLRISFDDVKLSCWVSICEFMFFWKKPKRSSLLEVDKVLGSSEDFYYVEDVGVSFLVVHNLQTLNVHVLREFLKG